LKGFSLAGLALLGTAYAGVACPNPQAAVVIDGQCKRHFSDIGAFNDWYELIDPYVRAGKCVSPGTNSVQCATQVQSFTYMTPVGVGEQGINTGVYTSCYLDPTTVLMNNAFNLTNPCDYNRCN
jgi:hypothetical protein